MPREAGEVRLAGLIHVVYLNRSRSDDTAKKAISGRADCGPINDFGPRLAIWTSSLAVRPLY